MSEVDVQAAIARMRARWTHPPVDRRDVEERLAVRLVDGAARECVVVETPPVCRLFVRAPKGWTSAYVHDVADVDAKLDELVARCA